MSLNKPAAGQAELTGRNVPKLKALKVSLKKKMRLIVQVSFILCRAHLNSNAVH